MAIVALRSLRGARVALCGRFGHVTRSEASELVRTQGGRVVAGVSRRTTALVVGALGWPIRDDGRPAAAIERAETLNAGGAAIRILPERRLLELCGRATPHRTSGEHDVESVGDMLGIEPGTLSRWSQLGLIRTGRELDFQDIVSLRTIADLVERGVEAQTIAETLVGLSRLLPGIERPLSQLSVLAESPRSLVVQVRDSLLTSEGQLLLDFERQPERNAYAFEAPSNSIESALQAEQEGDLAAALVLYDNLLAVDATSADVHFNRGNVLLALGRDREAACAYECAIDLDPHHAPAWYNLSESQERQGDISRAVASLEATLRVDPMYVDAMYNLASLLQGHEPDRAALLWRRYLAIDSTSEWADRARRMLRNHAE